MSYDDYDPSAADQSDEETYTDPVLGSGANYGNNAPGMLSFSDPSIQSDYAFDTGEFNDSYSMIGMDDGGMASDPETSWLSDATSANDGDQALYDIAAPEATVPVDDTQDMPKMPLQAVPQATNTATLPTTQAPAQTAPQNAPTSVSAAPTAPAPVATAPASVQPPGQPAAGVDPWVAEFVQDTPPPKPTSTAYNTSTPWGQVFADLEARGLWGPKYGAPVGRGQVTIGGNVVPGQPGTITANTSTTPGAPAVSSTRSQAALNNGPFDVSQIKQSGLLPTQMDTSSQDANLRQWAPALQWLQDRTGLDAGAVAAIIIAENGGGQSPLSAKQNNYFSISSVPGNQFQSDTSGRFAGYATPADALAHFVDLISTSPRYAEAWANRNDPQKFWAGLVKGGYIVEEPGFPISTWMKNLNNGREHFEQIAPAHVGVQAVAATDAAHATISTLTDPQAVDQTVADVKSGKIQGITPSQAALSDPDKWALCGPVAAMAFAARVGRPMTIEEAKQIGISVGWTPGKGMAGIDSEVTMLQKMGIAAHKTNGVDWNQVAADVQRGNPVIIDTPDHYFVVEGYDPATGKFDFGNTALVFRANTSKQTQFTPAEITQISGGTLNTTPRGAIFLDNPGSPAPSVVAGQSTNPGAASARAATAPTTTTTVTSTPGTPTTVTGPYINAQVGNRRATLWDIATAGITPSQPAARPAPVVVQAPAPAPAAAPSSSETTPDWRAQHAQAARDAQAQAQAQAQADAQAAADNAARQKAVKDEQTELASWNTNYGNWVAQANAVAKRNYDAQARWAAANAAEQAQQVGNGELPSQSELRPEDEELPPPPTMPSTPTIDALVNAKNKQAQDAWEAGGRVGPPPKPVTLPGQSMQDAISQVQTSAGTVSQKGATNVLDAMAPAINLASKPVQGPSIPAGFDPNAPKTPSVTATLNGQEVTFTSPDQIDAIPTATATGPNGQTIPVDPRARSRADVAGQALEGGFLTTIGAMTGLSTPANQAAQQDEAQQTADINAAGQLTADQKAKLKNDLIAQQSVANQGAAAQAQTNLPPLSSLNPLERAGADLGYGLLGAEQVLGNFITGAGQQVNSPELVSAGAAVSKRATDQQATGTVNPQSGNIIDQVIQGIPVVGATLALSAAAGPGTAAGLAAAAMPMFIQGGGAGYADAIAHGATKEQAAAQFWARGSVDALLGSIPAERALANIPGIKAAISGPFEDRFIPILTRKLAESPVGQAFSQDLAADYAANSGKYAGDIVRHFLVGGGLGIVQSAADEATGTISHPVDWDAALPEIVKSGAVMGITAGATQAAAGAPGLVRRGTGTDYLNPPTAAAPSGAERPAGTEATPGARSRVDIPEEPLITNRQNDAGEYVVNEANLNHGNINDWTTDVLNNLPHQTPETEPNGQPASFGNGLARMVVNMTDAERRVGGLNPDQRADILREFHVDDPNQREIITSLANHLYQHPEDANLVARSLDTAVRARGDTVTLEHVNQAMDYMHRADQARAQAGAETPPEPEAAPEEPTSRAEPEPEAKSEPPIDTSGPVQGPSGEQMIPGFEDVWNHVVPTARDAENPPPPAPARPPAATQPELPLSPSRRAGRYDVPPPTGTPAEGIQPQLPGFARIPTAPAVHAPAETPVSIMTEGVNPNFGRGGGTQLPLPMPRGTRTPTIDIPPVPTRVVAPTAPVVASPTGQISTPDVGLRRRPPATAPELANDLGPTTPHYAAQGLRTQTTDFGRGVVLHSNAEHAPEPGRGARSVEIPTQAMTIVRDNQTVGTTRRPGSWMDNIMSATEEVAGPEAAQQLPAIIQAHREAAGQKAPTIGTVFRALGTLGKKVPEQVADAVGIDGISERITGPDQKGSVRTTVFPHAVETMRSGAADRQRPVRTLSSGIVVSTRHPDRSTFRLDRDEPYPIPGTNGADFTFQRGEFDDPAARQAFAEQPHLAPITNTLRRIHDRARALIPDTPSWFEPDNLYPHNVSEFGGLMWAPNVMGINEPGLRASDTVNVNAHAHLEMAHAWADTMGYDHNDPRVRRYMADEMAYTATHEALHSGMDPSGKALRHRQGYDAEFDGIVDTLNGDERIQELADQLYNELTPDVMDALHRDTLRLQQTVPENELEAPHAESTEPRRPGQAGEGNRPPDASHVLEEPAQAQDGGRGLPGGERPEPGDALQPVSGEEPGRPVVRPDHGQLEFLGPDFGAPDRERAAALHPRFLSDNESAWGDAAKPPRPTLDTEYWSPSKQAFVPVDSSTEKAYLSWLDYHMKVPTEDGDVVRSWENLSGNDPTKNPYMVPFPIENEDRWGRYFPDLEVQWRDKGPTIVEIKNQMSPATEDMHYTTTGPKPRMGWHTGKKVIAILAALPRFGDNMRYELVGSERPGLGATPRASTAKYRAFEDRVNQMWTIPHDPKYQQIADPLERQAAIYRDVRLAVEKAADETFKPTTGVTRLGKNFAFVAAPEWMADKPRDLDHFHEIWPEGSRVLDQHIKEYGLDVKNAELGYMPLFSPDGSGRSIALESHGDIPAAERMAFTLAKRAGTADDPRTFLFRPDNHGADIVHRMGFNDADDALTAALDNVADALLSVTDRQVPTLVTFHDENGNVDHAVLTSRTPQGDHIAEQDFLPMRNDFVGALHAMGVQPTDHNTMLGNILHASDPIEGGVDNAIERRSQLLGQVSDVPAFGRLPVSQRPIGIGPIGGRNPAELAYDGPDFSADVPGVRPDATLPQATPEGAGLQALPDFTGAAAEPVTAGEDRLRKAPPPGFNPRRFAPDFRNDLQEAAQMRLDSGTMPTPDQVHANVADALFGNRSPAAVAKVRANIGARLTPLELQATLDHLGYLQARMMRTANDLLRPGHVITPDEFRDFLGQGIKHDALFQHLVGGEHGVTDASKLSNLGKQKTAKGETTDQWTERIINYAGSKIGRATNFTNNFVTAVNDAHKMGVPAGQFNQAWRNISRPETKIGDWAVGAFYNGIMGPGTAGSAFAGNTLQIGFSAIRDPFRTFVNESAAATRTTKIGRLTVPTGIDGAQALHNIGVSLGHEAWGTARGLVNGVQVFGDVLRRGTSDAINGLEAHPHGKLTNNKLGVFSPVANAGGHLLEGWDHFFYGADAFARAVRFGMEKGRLAALEARKTSPTGDATWAAAEKFYQNPTEDMLGTAGRVAADAALQGKMTGFGDELARIQKYGPGRAVFPFVRTTYNGMQIAGERSPIGIIGAMVDVIRSPGDGFSEKEQYASAHHGQRPIEERLWNGIVGTAIGIALMNQINTGALQITGAPNADPKKRKFETSEAIEPPYSYSLDGGKTWRNYKWMGDMAFGLLAMAEAHKAMENTPTKGAYIAWRNAIQNFGYGYLQMSVFGDLAEILTNTYTGEPNSDEPMASGVEKAGEGFLRGFLPIPGMGATSQAVGNMQDPYNRYPIAHDPIKRFQEDVAARMPYGVPDYGRQTLKPALTVWGQPAHNPLYGELPLWTSRTAERSVDPVDVEIDRIAKSNPGSDVYPPPAPNNYQGHQFHDPDEKYEWERKVGQAQYFLLNRTMRQPGFDALPDTGPESKETYIKYAYTLATDKAWDAMNINDPGPDPGRRPKYLGLQKEADAEGIPWWQLEREVGRAKTKYTNYMDAITHGRQETPLTEREKHLALGFPNDPMTAYQQKQEQERMKKIVGGDYDIPFTAQP